MAAPIIVWFRNELRLADHPALSAAAETGAAILPLYILDDATPGRFRVGGASRWWLHDSLAALGKDLAKRGGRLCLRQGNAPDVLTTLLAETGASGIYATCMYEPWEPVLEKAVAKACQARGADFRLFGGRLLYRPDAILTGEGNPYRVFTPFWKACLAADPPRAPIAVPKLKTFAEAESDRLDAWKLQHTRPDWAGGLRETWCPGEAAALARLGAFIDNGLANYADGRNRLDLNETSRLSPYLHFGEISRTQVWSAVTHAAESVGASTERGAEAYLRELGWREFSYHLLYHFPNMPSEPLRCEFADFPWGDDPTALAAWQKGNTGYPIVDAAMRELWHTGFMANRARMIVASFLVKHLLIPLAERRGLVP